MPPSGMQDTDQDSPLAGQDSSDLASTITQGTQAPQANPVGASVHARHGGLVTGLVGVLLDGLTAGMKAPMNDQGPAQAASTAAALPQQRQQQAQALQSQALQSKLQLAQMHIQMQQIKHMAASLQDEDLENLTTNQRSLVDQAIKDGGLDELQAESSRDSAVSKANELAAQHPGEGLNYMALISSHKPGGEPMWGVYQLRGKNTLSQDKSFTISGSPSLGIDDDVVQGRAGMPWDDLMKLYTQKQRDMTAKIDAANKAKLQADKPDRPATETDEFEKAFAEAKQKQPNLTRLDFKKQWNPKPFQINLGKNDTTKQDRAEAEGEIAKHFQTYSFAQDQSQNILDDLDAAGDGNQVASALAPLENTLFVTTKAGIKRVNQTELNMNLPNAGSISRNAQAWFDRKVSGSLPSGYVKDVKALIRLWQQSAEQNYRDKVDSVNERHGLEGGKKVPYGIPKTRESAAVDRQKRIQNFNANADAYPDADK